MKKYSPNSQHQRMPCVRVPALHFLNKKSSAFQSLGLVRMNCVLNNRMFLPLMRSSYSMIFYHFGGTYGNSIFHYSFTINRAKFSFLPPITSKYLRLAIKPDTDCLYPSMWPPPVSKPYFKQHSPWQTRSYSALLGKGE
jgi:hypothetical protein